MRVLGIGVAAAAAAYLGQRLIGAVRNLDLRGASVAITGGSRGLGLVLARELVAQGARVALIARTGADLERARHELEAAGGDVLTYARDVSDRAAIYSAIGDIAVRRGRLDALINDAGIMQVGPVDHMRAQDFESALDVHFRGPLYAMEAAISIMRGQGGGRIVNISSIGGKVAVPHMAPYCASKFALTGLSDAMRAELTREHIYVTTVCPWLMRTGSHLNVEVRGRHEQEFAWFAHGATTKGVAMSDQRAAQKILQAMREGRPSLDLGWQARAAVIANALTPNLMGHVMAVIARLLPAPTDSVGDASRTGWQSRSRYSSSRFTKDGDDRAVENNELRGHDPSELN
jgi:NAD(P)-dependent dehydrogenase (short-subunit alcohol dehydrogenase family)